MAIARSRSHPSSILSIRIETTAIPRISVYGKRNIDTVEKEPGTGYRRDSYDGKILALVGTI